MSTFRASYEGIGALLRSPMIEAEMLRRAEQVKARAEATAPDAPPYGEGYKYDFEASSGNSTTEGQGRRAYGRVTNTSDHAVYVEFGNGTATGEKHRTLGKALDAAKL